jgi:hypothetical protein
MLSRFIAPCLLVAPALAGQVTITTSSAVVPLAPGTSQFPWSATLSTQIPKFDHTLGVLDSYSVVEQIQYQGTIYFENLYPFTVWFSWPYSLAPGVAYEASFFVPPFDGNFDFAGPSGTFTGLPQPGIPINYLACALPVSYPNPCGPVMGGTGNYSTAYSDVAPILRTTQVGVIGPLFEPVYDPTTQSLTAPIQTDVVATAQAIYTITYNFHDYPSPFCAGAPNSHNALGAQLAATGHSSLSTDDLVLAASGLPPSTVGLFFQGTTSTFGGSVFGDGVRCVGGTIVRLGVKTASAGQMQYPAVGDVPISVRGLVPASGGYRTYQVWYRDPAPGFGSPAGFNLTGAVATVWTP